MNHIFAHRELSVRENLQNNKHTVEKVHSYNGQTWKNVLVYFFYSLEGTPTHHVFQPSQQFKIKNSPGLMVAEELSPADRL